MYCELVRGSHFCSHSLCSQTKMEEVLLMYKKHDNTLVWLSVIAAAISGYDSLAHADVFGLAGTQWMLVAIVLAIYAVYVKMRMA